MRGGKAKQGTEIVNIFAEPPVNTRSYRGYWGDASPLRGQSQPLGNLGESAAGIWYGAIERALELLLLLFFSATLYSSGERETLSQIKKESM